MYHWHMEVMAELDRQTVKDDMRQIRLEQLALAARAGRPGLFSRTMFNFANWMIHTGRQLRRRYEIPAAPRTHQQTGSFAR